MKELTLLSTTPFPGTVLSWISTGSLLETGAGTRGGEGQPGKVDDRTAACSRAVNVGKIEVTMKP